MYTRLRCAYVPARRGVLSLYKCTYRGIDAATHHAGASPLNRSSHLPFLISSPRLPAPPTPLSPIPSSSPFYNHTRSLSTLQPSTSDPLLFPRVIPTRFSIAVGAFGWGLGGCLSSRVICIDRLVLNVHVQSYVYKMADTYIDIYTPVKLRICKGRYVYLYMHLRVGVYTCTQVCVCIVLCARMQACIH